MKIKALKAAFPNTVPILMGYLFIGMVFGILLKSKGYNFLWAILMSGSIYAGSMQFVAINFLTSKFNIATVIIMTFMINARHLFYGLSMLEKFKDMGKQKLYMIFALTDETFSVLSSTEVPENINRRYFYFFIALLNHSYWIIGSALGAILGSIWSFNTKGIDFVITALFTVIFINQWKTNKNNTPAITGIFSSLTCLILFGRNNFIIPSMVLILIILTIFRKQIEGRQNK